jgi:hypothetical protein
VSRCFAALRQLHQRQYVSDDCFRSLIVSFDHSRLDYGDFVLSGLQAYYKRRMQSVLTAAARQAFHLPRYEHVKDALSALHWLRVELIGFKLAVGAFLAPPCLSQPVRITDLPDDVILVPPLPIHRTFLITVSLQLTSDRSSSLRNSFLDVVQSSPSLSCVTD